MGYIFLITAMVLNAIANIMMKIGSGNLNYFTEYGIIQGLLKNYILIIGVFLFALNVMFYVLALSKINLSIGYPIMAIGGLSIITIVSYFFLKEAISPLQLVGLLLILVGIICLTIKF
ncbi:MAG: SMR family transporter [Candidatus Peregrinibacteria bacterium]|nr:SMR family transporter [Candidatus Peregrinibacteria bacterium]MDZ4245464.1 SMR family transporter [Candidatus Gracilibacteria bacterium]